jgi:hypothetical protein
VAPIVSAAPHRLTDSAAICKSHQRSANKLKTISEVENDAGNRSGSDPEMPPRWVRVFVIVSLTLLLIAVPTVLVLVLWMSNDLVAVTRDHAAAMLGVPWAGGAAFIIVLVLRSSFGRVEYKVLSMEFKGASGPIVLWVFCFLAEVLGIRTLWRL